MGKNALGLPFEYKKLPEYFDAVNINKDTDSKNKVIEKLLKLHNVKTVLDLTCGTGSQVFFLTKQGYQCTGADFSPALLKIAREKASQANIDLTFIDGDMRTVKVGTFDAVITIFNAVGHLTRTSFEKAMKNIYCNLKPGGIYIFDILNSTAMTDTIVSNLAYHIQKKVGDNHIHLMQCSTFDRSNDRLTSYNNYMSQHGADKPTNFNNRATLQLYNAQTLREMLNKNGFETLNQYGIDGSAFIPKTTISILTVARKK